MKKSWKKILCSLLLAPCMFAATACGEEEPENLTRDLSVAEQEQAYTKLKTLASNVFANDGSKDQSFVLEDKYATRTDYDFTNSGLTGELLNNAKQETSNYNNMLDKITVFAGYKNNHIGYSLIKTEKKDTSEEAAVKSTTLDITRYNGQRYVNYGNDGENKITSYVDSNYANNTYIAGVNLVNENSEFNELVEILDSVNEGATFETFKPLIERWAAIKMTNGAIDLNDGGSYDDVLDNMDTLTSTYKLSLVDGNYVLNLDVNATMEDVVSYPLNHVADAVFTANVNVTFDENGISKIGLVYESGVTTEFTCKSYWLSDFYGTYTFKDIDVMKATTVRGGETVINFDYNFDDTLFNQTLTDYQGTGEQGVMENKRVSLKIQANEFYADVQVPYGSNLNAAVSAAMTEYLTTHNVKISNISLVGSDTSFSGTALVPSYDIEVYVETIDNGYEYNTTTVIVNVLTHGLEDEMQFNVGDNLLETIKAAYGVTDAEIIGIYSDAACTITYAANTEITENMVVYVKLDAAWSNIPPDVEE